VRKLRFFEGKTGIYPQFCPWRSTKAGLRKLGSGRSLSPTLFIAAILTDNSLEDLIRDTIHEDEQVKEIIKKLEKGETMKTWSMEDGLLYFQERIYVPKEKEVRRAVIESRHDAPSAGHPGQFRTFELLSRKYYWPGMKKSAVKYIQACESCIRSKHSNQAPAGLMLPIDIPSRPWEEITYNLIVGLPTSHGYDAVLTVVD
jgi:hypothetical protein